MIAYDRRVICTSLLWVPGQARKGAALPQTLDALRVGKAEDVAG